MFGTVKGCDAMSDVILPKDDVNVHMTMGYWGLYCDRLVSSSSAAEH